MTKLSRGPCVVHKFNLRNSEDATVLAIPKDAKIARVEQQAPDFARTLQMWTVIPADVVQGDNLRRFEVYGTGKPVPAEREHVASCLSPNGGVWHVFEDVSGLG